MYSKLDSFMKIFLRPEDRAIELLLASFFFLLTAAFLVFSVGVEISATFRTASYFIGVTVVVAVIFLSAILMKKRSAIADCLQQRHVVFVFLLALMVGVLTSSINRPDIDDSVYAPKAVFYTENPDQILDNSITWIAGLPAGANSFVFQYYETMQASLSWIFGVHFLVFYHIAFPFVVGFLAFCSVYLLLGLFYEETRVKLAGAVLLVLLALLLGETHRTYGNLSIARAFHGKFVLFYLGFYSWSYFSLKYFLDKNGRQLFFLSIVGVASTALTTTAFIFIPFLSLILYLSFFLARRELFGVVAIRLGLGYFIALLPIALLAFDFRREAQKVMSAGSSVNSGFSADFSGQLGYLVNGDFPFTPALFFVSLVVVIIFSSNRRFFIFWTVLPFVLLLNPVVSGFVIKNITTENAYWRMFYILPFPLLSIVAFCSVVERVKRFRTVIFVVFVFLAAAVFFLPSSVIRRENAAYLEFMGYKIHEPIRSYVKQFTEKMPPGSVFAPVEIASNIVVNTSKFPQYYLREDYLGLVVGAYLGRDNVFERVQAARYLYGDSTDISAKKEYQEFIYRYKPDYVILRARLANNKEAINHLTLLGYSLHSLDDSDYQVWRMIK